MCPLYPLHVIFMYLCLLLPFFLAVVQGTEDLLAGWKLSFVPGKIDKLEQFNSTRVQLACEGCFLPEGQNDLWPHLELVLASEDDAAASVNHELGREATDEFSGHREVVLDLDPFKDQAEWTTHLNVTGNFLGFTSVRAFVRDRRIEKPLSSYLKAGDLPASANLDLSITRKKTIASKLFGYSVALLISIAYINMGCAIDLDVIRESIRRPVGPTIGFVCQFVVMPLISFCLGYAFYDNAPMRLGLFVTGASPGGGASNIWTLMFGGNLNLSVTMTAISTFAAFFMIPLWLFTLGRVIFSEGNIVIPYYKIVTYAFCLVVPLSIGILITRYLPKVSKFLVRILKPMAFFLIMFILVFGVWANLYMFKLMDWKVWLTGMGLPWLGFAFGCSIARLASRPTEDVIAVAIETGVQNTGMSIFILWFTFDHPLGDMAGKLLLDFLLKGNDSSLDI